MRGDGGEMIGCFWSALLSAWRHGESEVAQSAWQSSGTEHDRCLKDRKAAAGAYAVCLCDGGEKEKRCHWLLILRECGIAA